MVNSEKSNLIKQEENGETYSLEFLGPFHDEECLSTALENEDRDSALKTWDSMATHCHNDDAISWAENHAKLLAWRKLLITSTVCLVFMIGEVIGGYAAHSLAIMMDAAHLLTDFGSIMVSLFSLWISSRPPSKSMNFGWHRSEILGAFLSALSIWAVTSVLVFIAIQRIINDNYEIHATIMLVTAGCAVAVNILMALVLHHSPTSHGHGHGPSNPTTDKERLNLVGHGHSHGLVGGHGNTSVRAAFIHVVGDLLQSFGVLLAATIIYFWPECKIADPICTFLFSIFVLATTFTILRDVFRILMEGAPKGVDFDSVQEVLLSVRGVKAAHSLHMWALTMNHTLLSVHVAVAKQVNPQAIQMEATKLLQTKFGFNSITIQMESYSEDMVYCTGCQDPAD